MDLNVQAYRLVQQVTADETAEPAKKSLTARKGGLKGGRMRAMLLSPERRTEIAKRASMMRWKKAQLE